MYQYTMVLLLALLAMHTSVLAQCKVFTKKYCIDKLEDYNNNGQYNGAVMYEGEEASLVQAFYSGQRYRVYVCIDDEIAENAYFEVMDYQKHLIYSNRENRNPIFDFKLESTQQLEIRVVIPKSENSDELIQKNGCVSIVVGFK
ncbi:MAG: hypothetical protein Kow0075_02990 [Salibacteraceae bacterium]